jgi:hypothetical protein
MNYSFNLLLYFSWRENQPLALNDIDHLRTPLRSPQTNGFVERFIRTVKEEFFELALRQTFYESVAALPYRPAWTPGWFTTTPSSPIAPTATWAAGPSIPSICFKQIVKKEGESYGYAFHA